MKDLACGAGLPGAQGKLRASIALAGLATTLSAPAGAAIVSVSDLDLTIEPGQTYSLPGMPHLELESGYTCTNFEGKVCVRQTYGVFRVWGVYAGSPKTLVSGAWVDLGVSAGTLIGPAGLDPSGVGASTNTSVYDDAYAAIEFMEWGERHYGWINFSVPEGNSDFVIHGYGYNDVAGASIRAGQTTDIPEPGTLALLAAGMIGAAAGRAHRRAARR